MSTIPLVNGPNFNGTVTINDDSFIPAQRDIDKIIRHIHGKAELDAAGFIRAEENDKWAQT